MRIKPPLRKVDRWGMGHYHAPRGNRLHNGMDFAALPESEVLANYPGRVTKLGYPYSDDLSFRYVEVTMPAPTEHKLRYFYINPSVKMGDTISEGQVLGTVQDLTTRYKDIINHFHFEVKTQDGDYIDPKEYL